MRCMIAIHTVCACGVTCAKLIGADGGHSVVVSDGQLHPDSDGTDGGKPGRQV